MEADWWDDIGPRKRRRLGSRKSPRASPGSSQKTDLASPRAEPSKRSAAFACALPENSGLRVGSACTGWCAEGQALTQLQVPHHIVFMCDADEHVRRFLAGNLPVTRCHNNVFDAAFAQEEPVDLLVAGPPCQPYSSEGKRLGSQDPRSNVVWPIVAYAVKNRPAMVLLENVPAWTSVGKDVFDNVVGQLRGVKDDSGLAFYNVYWQNLRSEAFGCAQHRKRLYLVALQRSLDTGFCFPEAGAASADFNAILDQGSVLHSTFTLADVPDDMVRT